MLPAPSTQPPLYRASGNACDERYAWIVLSLDGGLIPAASLACLHWFPPSYFLDSAITLHPYSLLVNPFPPLNQDKLLFRTIVLDSSTWCGIIQVMGKTGLAAISEKAYWLDILWSYTDPTWPWHTRPHRFEMGVGATSCVVEGIRGELAVVVFSVT